MNAFHRMLACISISDQSHSSRMEDQIKSTQETIEKKKTEIIQIQASAQAQASAASGAGGEGGQ